MTKPTGRPRGRPKTKEYVTLMARVPQDLADRVQRYAGLRRQSISVVLRDGLEVLLDEDRYRPFMSDTKRENTIASDTKEEPNSILSDIKSGGPPLGSPSSTTRSARRAEAPAAHSAMQSDSKADSSPPVPARLARPSSRGSATPRQARPIPAPAPPLLDLEPNEKDSVEWRRWAVLKHVHTAQVSSKPSDIARQIKSTSALVRSDLEYWRKQGRVYHHVYGGYEYR
jgi:hypothetical protein